MKKAGNVILGIAKVLLILCLCFILVYVVMASMNGNMTNGFNVKKGYYGVNPTWLDDADETVIDDIYARLDVDGTFMTAYNIYRKACEKLMLTKAYGVRAKSSISVEAAGLSLTCASNRTEQYKIAGTPMLNANQKTFASYVNTIYITDVSDPALSGVLKAAVQFATRGYSDGESNYIQKGKLEAMDGEEEVITWNEKYSPDNPSVTRTYEDDEIRDKCNFVITPDTIIPESVSIDREYDEKAQSYLYHITMDLDCEDSGVDSATYYEVKAISDLLGSNMKSLTYSQLKIDMTLYGNGYLMTWDTVQEWTLTYALSFLQMSGKALNIKNEMFSYDAKECEVINFTK